jgi:4-amino-4-deoxy-L-arabinose transferase-like glycosyltransferase
MPGICSPAPPLSLAQTPLTVDEFARWKGQRPWEAPDSWGPVALTLLVFGIVWLALLSFVSLSPPTDNIEQLTWVHSLEGGYYKHPPLPTWLFWIPTRLFGVNALTSYAVGAACTLASMAVMWRLLCRLRGEAYATIALLAALCITYYNVRLYYYNHNVVLMLFVAASAAIYWQAFRTGLTRWWLALGLAMGLGALAKYQIAVSVACILAFWLHQRSWRVPAQRRGLLLAALVSMLVFTPHVLWLRAHDFAPIRYATSTSLGLHAQGLHRWFESMHWLVDQLLNRALPAWILLGLTIYHLRRQIPRSHAPRSETVPETAPASRAFLLIYGFGPLVFMVAMGLLTGAELQLHWGTPFLLFAVPAVMELAGQRVAWRAVSRRSVYLAFAALQVVLLLQDGLSSPRGPTVFQDGHWRMFDSAALAQAVEGPARAALNGDICVVSGPPAVAGALALQLADRPKVLIDGRYDRSPWVAPSLVSRCGALEIREGPVLAGWTAAGPRFPSLSWVAEPPVGAPFKSFAQSSTRPSPGGKMPLRRLPTAPHARAPAPG